MTQFAHLVADTAEGAVSHTVVVPGHVDEQTVLSVLGTVFGGDDACGACRLVVGKTELGFVARDTVLDLLTTSTKGYGSGEGLFLPGVPTSGRLIELACPVADCPEGTVTVVVFDEDDPPRCRLHTSTALERAP